MVWLLIGCSEYDIHEKDRAEPPFSDGEDTSAPMVPTDSDTPVDTDTGPPPDTSPPSTCSVEMAAPRSEIDDTCAGIPSSPPVNPWDMTVEWSWGGTDDGVIATPMVGDLDGDGIPEVVFVSGSTYWGPYSLVVLDGATGAEEWTISGGFTYGEGVALGDIDGDGDGEIVTWVEDADDTPFLVAYDASGGLVWSTEVPDAMFFTYPSLVDLDGDGTVEILANDQIVDGATGAIEAALEISNVTSAESIPVAADLDLDGTMEILYETRVFSADGTLRFQCGLTSGYFLMPHPVDADGDPEGEVVTTTTAGTTLCDTDGTELWSESGFSGFPGAVGDFDDDGSLDFAGPGYTGLTLRDASGGATWTARVTDVSGAAGVSSWDVDADGVPELLHAGERALSIVNGTDGHVLASYTDHYSVTMFETPSVADVDGDGHGEILLPSNWYSPALTVLGSADGDWPAAPTVYNEYNYDGWNVGEDLAIPASRTPPWSTPARIFRGQPSTALSTDLPNANAAVTDVCVASCEAGAYAEVAVQVWNDGAADVPAGTAVEVYADGVRVAGSTLSDALLVGASVEMVFPLTADQLGSQLEARVETGVDECHADTTETVESPCAP